MKAFLFGLALFLMAGCGHGSTLTHEDYLAKATAVANDFRDYWETTARSPLPSVRGLPRAERLRQIAEVVRADAAKNLSFAHRMAALDPPADLADHKRVFEDLFNGVSAKLIAWSNAIQAGDQAKEKAAGKQVDQFLVESLDGIITMLKNHGLDPRSIVRMRESLAAELG